MFSPRGLRLLTGLLLSFATLLAPSLGAQETEAIEIPAPVHLRGDVDGDGRVTTRDARLVTAHVAGGAQIPEAALPMADADGDARVSSRDALLIESFARGRNNTARFGVGQPLGEDDLLNGIIRLVSAPPGSTAELRSGDDQLGVADDTLGAAISVLVEDAGGDPISGVAVQWEVLDGDGSLRKTRTGTGVSGASANRWILGDVGAQTVRAIIPGADTVEFSASAVAASGVQIEIVSGNNMTGMAGDTLGVRPRVRLTAGPSQPVAATVHWEALDGGAVTAPATHSEPGTGFATTRWILGPSDGEQRLVARAPGGDSVIFVATATPPAEVELYAFSGDNQVANPGDLLPEDLVVRAVDPLPDTVPISGFVHWSVTSGGGTLQYPKTYSTTNGIARNNWTLGPTRGYQTVQAEMEGAAPLELRALAQLLATDQFTFNGGDTVGVAGQPLDNPPSVLVRDQDDNPIPGYPVKFLVTAGDGQVSSATETCDSVEVFTDLSGVATLTEWKLGPAQGPNTVRASGGPHFIDFEARGGASGPTDMVANAGDGQSATVNTAVATAPQVLVTDVDGNPVAGVEVTFAVASGGGSVTDAVATTDASGLAAVGSWTLGTAAGANTLDASATGLTTVTFTATGTADAATSMVASAGDGQSATAGAAVATDPAVTITDTYGNPVAGVGVTFAVASGGGSVTGENATTDASGVATVGSWT
ncbi:MAG TPA: dockerin type I domain-containing protein, partial [Longimicrobium sp.]|nr:dockerin type I domain-containing protein [Longimicrobium sp.]